jgi:hypothetical protein
MMDSMRMGGPLRFLLRFTVGFIAVCVWTIIQAQVQTAPAPAPVWPTDMTVTPAKKPAAKKSTAQKPAAAQQKSEQPASAPVVLAEPPVPVQQIRQLGLTQCIGVVDRMSRETLNRTYDTQAGWNREAPTGHVFQSVVVLNSPQNTPRDGLAAIIAAPTPGGSCDGVALQVFPLASDCPSVRKLMEQEGSTSRPILDTQIMTDRNGKRLFLLPGAGKTCVAVAVDSTFGGEGPH